MSTFRNLILYRKQKGQVDESSVIYAIPSDYDWYTPFSDDFTEKVTGITGSTDLPEQICISTDDSRFGSGFLHVNKSTSDYKGLTFTGSENYFNYSEGNATFSFWLRAPNWNGNRSILMSNSTYDGEAGFVFFNYYRRKLS